MSKLQKMIEETQKMIEANEAELKTLREEFDRADMNNPHELLRIGHRISELCEERDFLLRFKKSVLE